MRGLLKTKSPGTQLLVVISIALVGFFIIGLIGTMVLAQISGISIFEMGDASKWDTANPSTILLIRGMQVIQFISLFLLPAFICARLFSTDSKTYLGLKKPVHPSWYIMAILSMVVALPLVNWLGELNRNVQFPLGMETWLKAKELEAARMIKILLSRNTVKDLILNLICIAGLAAVGEELLFRGLLQRLFIKIFRNPWVGIGVSALLFSAMHMQFYGFLPRFALGILLGIAYWYSGSLWVAIIAHFIYDAVLITLAWFNPEMLNDESTVALSNLALWAVISFALVALVITWMKKKSVTTYDSVYADDAIPVKDHPF